MIKIRLMRIGGKGRPFYRVVAVNERSKRTGGFLELLGTYNPLTTPHEIKLKQDRIDYWVKQGAQPSVGFLRIIGKAPQRPARKPKKESKQQTVSSEQPKAEETAAPASEETSQLTSEMSQEQVEKASEEAAKSENSEEQPKSDTSESDKK